MAVFASLSYLVLIISFVTSLSFNFDSFNSNDQNIRYEADAYQNGVIQLTKNQLDIRLNHSIGRATYSEALYLWDKASGNLTDFTTYFSFGINSRGSNLYADGLAFFLAPEGSRIPDNKLAAGGGLGLAIDSLQNTSRNHPFVAVEFDTFSNYFDPPDDHVGVNINSMVSVVNMTWFSSIPNNKTTDAWITYNSTSKNLSVVFIGYHQQGNTTVPFLQTLSYNIDLRDYLPELNGSLLASQVQQDSNPDVPLQSPDPDPSSKKLSGLVNGLISGGCVSVALSVLILFIFWRKRKFAGRHKHLVQLIGWCHQKRELLLVYEFMPNGSLDYHLFKGRSHLTWPIRFKIAQGLASALLYLHDEWEQCVGHRDIKSSNIMLDSNFNAKLGDFGLARLVDHDKGSQTTVLAGTMGYMAPECVTTGKASKETDVYSFGVVALEIACGRKPIDPKAEEHQVNIIEWAWRLYGMGNLSEAVDPRLSSEFNEEEVEHLLIVGLWCAHPDNNCRPSIRQAIQVLNFEAPLPTLPPNMPVSTY
ncbi:L-type lectin-domain containing receptor kinase IX.2-like [Solanum tuberosum]|uniref:L-type lectin-domain containing receptor kinase IX.2-like n=1 Tax=Solanum tuberosum TaxID=4113 RepID=UPI000739FAF3|nr:PREDICTED: L-type lectin-domain containing receptor kinase IX.2-like [Solanum tuberosum]